MDITMPEMNDIDAVKAIKAFVFGRHVMTCCVQDIQFAGLLAKWRGAAVLEHGGWAEITAKVVLEFSKVYGEKGPVLHCEGVVPCNPCDPEVATF